MSGKLRANAYEALWKLADEGVQIIPITGRPAGWCEMIARFWPVAAVVGENGGFYFRYHDGKMFRHFTQTPELLKKNRRKLNELSEKILREVPGSAIASDQFTRLFDLAVDYCEDVPKLNPASVKKIVDIFVHAGAQAKVSSIHVNGWFGEHNKLTTCQLLMKNEFHFSGPDQCAFVGDSPNDEPMFEFFPLSFAVANIKDFAAQMKHLPAYVASAEGGDGFTQIAKKLGPSF